jgi:hypothetical protein
MREIQIIVVCLFLIALIGVSCNFTYNKKEEKPNSESELKKDKKKPIIDIEVNKQYDRSGNLISFDSTYKYLYSTADRNKTLMDSLYDKFVPSMNKQFSKLSNTYFNKLFFNDTLIYSDFFHHDFFSKRFELNKEFMNEMMRQMDSIKNEFYKNK